MIWLAFGFSVAALILSWAAFLSVKHGSLRWDEAEENAQEALDRTVRLNEDSRWHTSEFIHPSPHLTLVRILSLETRPDPRRNGEWAAKFAPIIGADENALAQLLASYMSDVLRTEREKEGL